jgi:hypothetical protein
VRFEDLEMAVAVDGGIMGRTAGASGRKDRIAGKNHQISRQISQLAGSWSALHMNLSCSLGG